MTDTPMEIEMRRASDEFLGALAALRAMEEEKRTMASDDRRRVGLAIDIEELALGLLARSQYQTRLAEEAQRGSQAIPRRAGIVLGDWRDAERRLRDAQLTVRRTALESLCFQEEYRRSIDHVEEHDRSR